MRLSSLGALVAIGVALVIPAVANADADQCTRAINKEHGKYVKTLSKELEKCKRSVLTKGQPATLGECPDAKAGEKIARAASKMRSKVEGRCGGANKTCSDEDLGADADDSLASINWDIGRCMDFESGSNGSCINPIRDCGDVVDCLQCIADAAVDQGICSLLYDRFNPINFVLSSGNVTRVERRCQKTISQETLKFLQKKHRLLEKCWDKKLNGKSGFDDGDPCPDTDPTLGTSGDNKTVEKIKKLELKKIDKICRRCGGGRDGDGDGLCDEVGAIVSGGVAVNLDDIVTLPFTCPTVRVAPDAVHPGGWDCGAIGDVTTLQEYVDCIDCVTEFKVDCMASAGVGDGNPGLGIAYPGADDECNSCAADVTGEPCPAVVQLDTDGPATNLDSGWTGISHDFDLPSGGRLTLAVSGCDGTERPTCGECALSGPLPNVGGTEFSNQRCAGNGSWVECSIDQDCVDAGVAGPCVFYFGPPLPQSAGGVPICITNQLTAGVTGTVDVESGGAATVVKLTARAHTGITLGVPCPQCVGSVCTNGPRAGQACTVNGQSSLFGNLSLDCPPSQAGVIGTLPITLESTTGLQTRTLSAANPNCTASGFSTSRCFCSTCNDSSNTPCTVDADCVLTGATTCGGPRCLGGTTPGIPCGAPSDCLGGGQCGVPGQPTAPNQCQSATCTPNGADPDSVDEGVCATGPFDLLCSIDTFRSCLTNAQCRPPSEGGSCTTCSPGNQTCDARTRECFNDNGVIGGSVSAAGSEDPACSDTARPTLAALFCIPPTAESAPNAVGGLPGLGRLTLPAVVSFDP
jgi:hypothetical protein